MSSIVDNPYAIYVRCDGAMSYDARNTSGIGIEIIFPECVGLEPIYISKGKYEDANIERVELEALIQGMKELLNIHKANSNAFSNVGSIIINTDRAGLEDRTNIYRIKEWRRNKWKNHEGKEIKNKDLLDQIDKIRRKVHDTFKTYVDIKYIRRKKIKKADKLAQKGKKRLLSKRSISQQGTKVSRRIFDGSMINYRNLSIKDTCVVRIYKKESLGKRVEVSGEIWEGRPKGKKIIIIVQNDMENRLHRHHIYEVRLKSVFQYHVEIFKTIKEIKTIE